MRRFLTFVAILISAGVLFFRASVALDPDFGWHLRSGQIILSSGVPKTDLFSYTMPSFPYIDHSWLADTLTASIYPYIGRLGIGLFIAVITMAAIFLSFQSAFFRQKHFWLPFFLLSTAAVLPFSSARPLVFTWLIFSIFLWIFADKRRWEKWKFFTPLLFLAGANLHGGFISYLILLVFFIFTRAIKKSLSFIDILLGLLCLAVSFVNPYGPALWKEVLSTIFSSALKENIVEWKSVFEWFNPAVATVTTIAMISLVRYREKHNLFNILAFLFYSASSILAIRNIPLLILVSIPVLTFGLNSLDQQASDKKRLNKAFNIFAVISIIIFTIQIFFILPEMFGYRENIFYPKKAVSFLRKSPKSGEIFSLYNWGGYLIWRMPEKKVFIDGRMPVWVWVPPNNTESPNAFGDYLQILSGGKDFQPIFAKFNIKTVLWPKDSNLDFLSKLEKSGWSKTYEDQTAVIYVVK